LCWQKNKFTIFDEGSFMHKRITFRSMAHSDAIEKHVLKKIAKVDRFFKREPEPISMEIILEPHREKHFFKVEFLVNSHNYHIVIKTEGMDMYAMIDEAISKMVKDIARKKEKMGHDLHHFSYTV